LFISLKGSFKFMCVAQMTSEVEIEKTLIICLIMIKIFLNKFFVKFLMNIIIINVLEVI